MRSTRAERELTAPTNLYINKELREKMLRPGGGAGNPYPQVDH